MHKFISILLASVLACAVGLLVTGLPVFAANPTVSYTALSDAARKAGRLAGYDNCAVRQGKATLGDCVLTFTVPKTARAYDVVPIRYSLTRPAGARRAAVEAVAFDDAGKAKNKPLYDLAIPGNMQVRIEYLGSVSAAYDQSQYVPLTPDPRCPISPFPPIKRDPMVCSSTVTEADGEWFRFKLTNTGDTILDPEGFGAAFVEPRITKLDKNGKEEWSAGTINHYERFLTYLYPSESWEFWVNFYCPKLRGMVRGLVAGDYRIDILALYRYHRNYNWGINIWGGAGFARLELPIKVTKDGGQSPVKTAFKIIDTAEKMPGDYDRFEEFMTSLRVYPAADLSPQPQPPPARRQEADKGGLTNDTLYLQIAPWTKNVVVKLILTDPNEIAVARVPIKITDETLKVKYNPKNVMVVSENGKEAPAIVAQAMPGMRTGFQLGPYPEVHMLREIQEMKDLGVNVIANTAGGWYISELVGRRNVELHSATYKYWYDVLVRKMNMKLMGWSLYPPSGKSWYDCAAPLLGRAKVTYSTSPSVYGSGVGAIPGVDMGDPIVPEVIAAWAKYNYGRWGDLWFHTKDGRTPVDIEDTWGWMRDDINLRYRNGPLALGKFRQWAKAKYETIEKANATWGSSYKSFAEIDPEANQGIEGEKISHGPVYNKRENVFHDWSPAVEDWDAFRTELRMEIYRKATEIMRKTILGAEIELRTEGANLTIKGDPKSENMHWRHVYYSQRRNAMVQDVVDKANVLHFYSDYTTLPYSEDEWRQAMREMVARGIIPAFVPQFDHMRDILIQPDYGREDQIYYGLEKPSKRLMVHCLMAAYPWWKATYEEGGAPGIIWSDYLCDGFATETQKRELRLLREHFNLMKK